MQDNTATTTATTTTTEAAPTLAELIQRRAEARAEAQRESERRAQVSREEDRREALDYILTWAGHHISPTLAASLRIVAAVDDSRLDEDTDDYSGIALAGFLQLDVSGAGVDDGVDDGDDAQRDPSRDERWTISHDHRPFRGYAWTLRGPHDYCAILGNDYATGVLDAAILDAIAAYPDWLASASERAAADQARAAQHEAKRQRDTPRRFVFVEGLTPDDVRPGVLAVGNRLLVRVLDPSKDGGIIGLQGILQSHNERWLLLNVEGECKPVGAQRLVPLARVHEILPLPDLVHDRADAAAE